MSSTTVSLRISHPDGDDHSTTDNDEIKIFECEKPEDDHTDRLSPVIKEEESTTDRLNNEQQFQNFFPYFISPYYQASNIIPSFDKMSSLESLSKFISPSPAHRNLDIDQHAGIPNVIFPLPSSYSQHWMFPSGYPFSSYSTPKMISQGRREIDHHFQGEYKQKKSHIKKPLNAFMLFMKEQRAQVVQECTLRESAAINQILGRKWHELDRNVQQKYYDMARNERMKHMQLYPGWSARDNYGVRKKRVEKGKKRDKNQECLNQKKCRARFGLEQQADWCKHCKRKKKCLRYTENETASMDVSSWSDDDDTDSNDCDVIPMIEQNNNLPIHTGISTDFDEEEYQPISNRNHLMIKPPKKDLSLFLPRTTDFKREI